METNKNKTLEDLKRFASYHFKILKPAENRAAGHILEIKVSGYSDMIALAANLIKMCSYTVQNGRTICLGFGKRSIYRYCVSTGTCIAIISPCRARIIG